MENTKVSEEEWQELLFALLNHHSLFYKIGEMGKPILSDSIDTACVAFSPEGDYINFLFNPEFWAKSTTYEKTFVICHEALHLILNHGKRFRDADNRTVANVAMDIVVNHTLVNRFGFIRENITDHNELCWIDTIFKNDSSSKSKIQVAQDETSEYYFNMLIKNKNITKNLSCRLVDAHDFLDGDDKQLFDKLNHELSEEEKNTLKKFIDKHGNQKPGDQTGGSLHFAAKQKAEVKKKWETVIQKWTLNRMKNSEKCQDQWARKSRTFAILQSNMFLPSEMEIEDIGLSNDKIEIHFYLDTSGSCWHLKDRFFAAAESLPHKKFNVKLFCFDTKVFLTDLTSRKMHGGGGTAFNIIENNIQKMIKQDKSKYPESVWVMTDGYGNDVDPEFPNKWHWFLTPMGNKTNIPQESKVFDLDDFV
jgi:predicted metal-dependent peptidase